MARHVEKRDQPLSDQKVEVLNSASSFLTISFFILPSFAWQKEGRTFGMCLLCEIMFLTKTRVGHADVAPSLNEHLGCSCVLVRRV